MLEKIEIVQFYDRTLGVRNDDYARQVCIANLAGRGYRVESVVDITAVKHGPFWKYNVPIVKVIQ